MTVDRYISADSHVLEPADLWLERNRTRLDNKYHASKFYLLAVLLPWLTRRDPATGTNA